MKISLITVSFNSDRTLCDTIQSIISQHFTNIEYIIVDGLSQDNTIEIIKKYEPLFQGRLKWISEKDNGLYDAMNKGIRMATGDIVGIINSDDFYHRNDVITKVVEVFDNTDTQVVYGDVRFVNPKIWIKQCVIILLRTLPHICSGMVLCLRIRLSLLIESILRSLAIIKQIIR